MVGHLNAKGYLRYFFNGAQHFAHRLVCETYHGFEPMKPFVNHKDRNKLNNYWKNLEWCTTAENNRHAATIKSSKRTNPNKVVLIIKSSEVVHVAHSLHEAARFCGMPGRHSYIAKLAGGVNVKKNSTPYQFKAL